MTKTLLTRRELGHAALSAYVASGLRAYGQGRATSESWLGYSDAVVIDALGGPGGFDPSQKPDDPLPSAFVVDAKRSGLTAVHSTVGAVGNGPKAFEETVKNIAFVECELTSHPDVFVKIWTGMDIASAKAAKRLGIIYGFQDASPLESELSRLDTFFQLGLRILQPTYNVRNLMGDGCLEKANAGLSQLGHRLVERANQLGICLDLSHGGRRTMSDIIAASKRPVAITHTGCAALVDLPRNTPDEQLRAVAERGGVVGIYFMPFLRASGQQSSEDVVRHIEHALKVCGEDHVGIGTDGGISRVEITPEFRKRHRDAVSKRKERGIGGPGEDPEVFTFAPDLNTPRRLEKLAVLLSARGHSEKRVRKILGANFQRLFTEVWPSPPAPLSSPG